MANRWKDVDYLMSIYFTSLIKAADDLDDPETSLIPSFTTGERHSGDTKVDE